MRLDSSSYNCSRPPLCHSTPTHSILDFSCSLTYALHISMQYIVSSAWCLLNTFCVIPFKLLFAPSLGNLNYLDHLWMDVSNQHFHLRFHSAELWTFFQNICAQANAMTFRWIRRKMHRSNGQNNNVKLVSPWLKFNLQK